MNTSGRRGSWQSWQGVGKKYKVAELCSPKQFIQRQLLPCRACQHRPCSFTLPCSNIQYLPTWAVPSKYEMPTEGKGRMLCCSVREFLAEASYKLLLNCHRLAGKNCVIRNKQIIPFIPFALQWSGWRCSLADLFHFEVNSQQGFLGLIYRPSEQGIVERSSK